MLTIVAARGDRDLATVRELFQEYAGSLDFDLEFQDFQRELEDLPGEYAETSGLPVSWIREGSRRRMRRPSRVWR
jgi:hypothetical protein